MSVVTNVMMQFSGADGDDDENDVANLDHVQAIVERVAYDQRFSYIAGWDYRIEEPIDPVRPRVGTYWGGSKYPETTILAGAFNCFSLEDFIEEIEKLTWKVPELFRLFVQDQEADAFGVWILREGKVVNVVEQGRF